MFDKLRKQTPHPAGRAPNFSKTEMFTIAMYGGQKLDDARFENEFYHHLGNKADVGLIFSRVTHDMIDKNGCTGPHDRAIQAQGHHNLSESETEAVIDAARAAAKTCGGLCQRYH